MTTKIIGILNITPDSFSDGGKYFNQETALKHAKHLIDSGADIIDIGAQSTRPGAILINEEEEWHRLEPVLANIISIAHNANVEVSIDTDKAKIADKAISIGVDYINDVSGTYDKEMIRIVSASNVKLFLMHNLGIPANQNNIIPKNVDPIGELVMWFQKRITTLNSLGIANNNIIIDPGIGFGKNAEQSWYIIKNIDKLKKINLAVCVGHSRKSMFSSLNTRQSNDRDIETLTISILLAKRKIDYVRVHNVELHFQSFNILKKLSSLNI